MKRILYGAAALAAVAIAPGLASAQSFGYYPPQPYYPAITVPVLLIPAIPADLSGAAARRARIQAATGALPDATIREYVGADHDLHAQHPDELADDLLGLAARIGE